MKEKIRVAYIGLGRRGILMLRECFSRMHDVEVSIICDLCTEKMEDARKLLIEKGKPEPKMTTNYEEAINEPDIDAVLIMTGWDSRPEMAKKAMLAGKYTAIEVGCAENLQQCYDLVKIYEEKGTPLMMLENCCYGRREMMVLNMVKQGLFGELVHCTGAYAHYLNEVEFFEEIHKNPGKEKVDHYRLRHYIEGNRENYPTHEFGPLSKILGINRGNRPIRLSSFASKSVGIKDYSKTKFGDDFEYSKIDYNQGDIINTIITCANGETVALCLDTTLPRAYYSRNFSVRGTKGMSSEERKVIFLEGMKEEIENNETEMSKKYDHPLHVEYESLGTRGGHGGMDWLVCRAFVEAVKNGTDTPIDAYDTATWLAIGVLSEQSIKEGGMPVEFPDFTNGKWKTRGPAVNSKYYLDEVIEDKATKIFDERDT